MKILHVVSAMDPAMGGPTRVVSDVARIQAEMGHSVHVCTTTHASKGSKRFGVAAIEALLSREVVLHCFDVDFIPLLWSRKMHCWLRERLRDFDIVHVHGLYRFPPTYAARRARRLGVPYIVRPHGNLDPYLFRQSSRSVLLKRLYERWFDFPNLKAASSIHYTTEDERDRTAFLGFETPNFIVPNGIDGTRYATLPARGAFRKRLDIGESPLVIFLGRINFKKGLDLLVPAFAEVLVRHPAARLAIVGPDNERYGQMVRKWVYERHIDEQVHFVGPLDGIEAIEALVDADVFTLPSYTENFGITVVEAMACGTPVVISDQVNIHREVEAAGGGLVVPCSAKALGQALSSLLDDPESARCMGKAGRQAALLRYSWPSIVKELTGHYRLIIKQTVSASQAGCDPAQGNS